MSGTVGHHRPASGAGAVKPGEAAWVAAVQSDIAGWEASAAWSAAMGLDPDDPFAELLVADEGEPFATVTVGQIFSGAEDTGLATSDAADSGMSGPTRTTATSPTAPDAPDMTGVMPGPELAALLDGMDLTKADAFDTAEAVGAYEQLMAWAQAGQARALTALAMKLEPTETASERFASLNSVTVTAADACTVWPWTRPQAERRTARALTWVERFPATLEAMHAGRVDAHRAGIIVDELGRCDDHVAALVEAAVLPHVHEWTSVKLTRVLRRLVIELAPETARARNERARKSRDVWVEPAADGMAWLHAYLPAEQAEAIMAALTAAAHAEHAKSCAQADTCPHHHGESDPNTTTNSEPGTDFVEPSGTAPDPEPGTAPDPEPGTEPDPEPGTECASRTLGQRRADALAAMAWMSLSSGHLGGTGCVHCGSVSGAPLATAHGRAVTVNVTVSLPTLLGLNDHPAELDGYGPITADVARRLAASGVWRWVGTDPVHGWALNYGRTRYSPPQDLVDYILLRDRECSMPGCHQPARYSDIDHRIPYPEGPTSAANCGPLCRTCHLHKHHAGWSVENIAPGVQRWTSPSGHTSTVTFPRQDPESPETSPAEPEQDPHGLA